MRYADNNKTIIIEQNWGREPGFAYPSDIRFDEYGYRQATADEDENLEENVNQRKKRDSKDSSEEIESEESEEEEVQANVKSWWSYLLPYNYLH